MLEWRHLAWQTYRLTGNPQHTQYQSVELIGACRMEIEIPPDNANRTMGLARPAVSPFPLISLHKPAPHEMTRLRGYAILKSYTLKGVEHRKTKPTLTRT